MYTDDNGSERGRLLAAAAAHPAVIWQSHLLDVTPATWPSMKVGGSCSRFIPVHPAHLLQRPGMPSLPAQGSRLSAAQVTRHVSRCLV